MVLCFLEAGEALCRLSREEGAPVPPVSVAPEPPGHTDDTDPPEIPSTEPSIPRAIFLHALPPKEASVPGLRSTGTHSQ
jgi:hypothetical protein